MAEIAHRPKKFQAKDFNIENDITTPKKEQPNICDTHHTMTIFVQSIKFNLIKFVTF